VLAVLGACTLGTTSVIAQASIPMPDEARKALNRAYPGWQWLPEDRVNPACRPAGGAGSPVVRSDLEGDGAEDLAGYVDVAGTAHLVILLARSDDDYQLYDLALPPAPVGALPFRVEPRGAAYWDAATNLEKFFSVNTVVVHECGTARHAYRWTGVGFERARLSDQAPPQVWDPNVPLATPLGPPPPRRTP
jgi:hypothetical protein